MAEYLLSQWLRSQPIAKNTAALERILLAQARVRMTLGREVVAHQKTLEQKIADQGPDPQRVHPHLIGLALKDLTERGILAHHKHSGVDGWYTHRLERPDRIAATLERLAPLYARVSKGEFPNRVGDALEVIVFKCLQAIRAQDKGITFFGSFDLSGPKDKHGRYPKTEPPHKIAGKGGKKLADFILTGRPEGPLAIECKNYREWLYPHSHLIKELIIKAYEMEAIPVLIHRRIQYSTISNLLRPAGIVSHESYYQYYPADEANLAEAVKHKRSLGFTDVIATEVPHKRTMTFFKDHIPFVLPAMATRWEDNREALYDFASERINMAQLYSAIGSPAGGKWEERGNGDDPYDDRESDEDYEQYDDSDDR